MKQTVLTIEKNLPIARDCYRMELVGDTSAITAPGQFLNFQIAGRYLRRPISICDAEDGRVTVLYKVVGGGTADMAGMQPGDTLDTLVGLGNGFDASLSGDAPLLVGGGIGVPPLYMLCKQLIAKGAKPTVILGFRSAEDVVLADEFAALGATVHVATEDGSYGTKGFVMDVMKTCTYSYFYSCGPMPMFRAMEKVAATDGEYSFEERMGCGFGACMGCSCKTLTGYKRICVDGPVMKRGEILWDAQA